MLSWLISQSNCVNALIGKMLISNNRQQQKTDRQGNTMLQRDIKCYLPHGPDDKRQYEKNNWQTDSSTCVLHGIAFVVFAAAPLSVFSE